MATTHYESLTPEFNCGLSLRRRALLPAFDLDNDLDSVLKLLQKYANVPMSLADACLVRMSETFADPFILTQPTRTSESTAGIAGR
jgi:hypothetical protein